MAKKPATSKTEALSIRIDPRLRFGLELMARKQRRSVTGVVEWMIENSLTSELVNPLQEFSDSFADVTMKVWSPNEVERLVNLGQAYPELLTYEETRLWQVVRETALFWIKVREGKMLDPMVLEQWEIVMPLITEAADKNTVRGLSKRELEKAGYESVPF